MKIEKILIVVELEDGTAHQVLASQEMKRISLNLLKNKDGVIMLDKECEPFTLEYKDD